MGTDRGNEPTFGRSVFVGSDSDSSRAIRALLATVELFLSEDGAIAEAPYEGNLSDWIAELGSKPIEFSFFVMPGGTPNFERRLLEESASLLVDPRNDAEVEITKKLFVDGVSSDDVRRLLTILQSSDPRELMQFQKEMAEKLKPILGPLTPGKLSVAMAHLTRMRALRAAVLSMVLYKDHALSLISKARDGDRRATLDLVQIDKLFLIDDCTRRVVRNAMLRADKHFLNQLAAALKTRPKTGAKKACRLYLYLIWLLKAETPQLAEIYPILDPDGGKFRSFGAFEKFVARCREEFNSMTTPQPDGSPTLGTELNEPPSSV
jgi:hypothetical protein